MSGKILIVDDDPVQRRLLLAAVNRMGHDAVLASGGAEALDILAGPGKADIRAVILDLIMEGIDGLAVLAAMGAQGVRLPVIVQTAQGGIEVVVNAMRAGAFDFVVKPVSPERLKMSLDNALKLQALKPVRASQQGSQGSQGPAPAGGKFSFKDIVCDSPAMERVMRVAEKAARSAIPVLIEGESGVGKELIARAIQGSSERRRKPFIAVNCGALPENLVESILFGHEKGAFTGASDKHVGKFEEASGGTLFLDEIGELPLDIQVKLLRAIQESEIDPVGARRPVRIDIRLISATNRNLLEEVKAGRFREDLFYRLSVLPMTLPALRERRQDIPALVRLFIARFGGEANGRIRDIAPDALAALCAHDWPGNIRELENAIFRAVVLCEERVLTLADFPQVVAQMPGFTLPQPETVTAASGAPAMYAGPDEALASPEFHSLENAGQAAQEPGAPAGQFGWMPILDGGGQVRKIDEIEAQMIRFAIDLYEGHMSEVARRLGIGRSTLYRKLKDYGIESAEEAVPGPTD